MRRWLRETEPSRTVRDEAALRLFFLWLLEPTEAEAYLRGEAERARATLAEFERIAAQETRTARRPAPTAPRSSSACMPRGRGSTGRRPRSQHPPAVPD